ncbi:hypothetical protein NC651_020868 [Populus alba x Populus x berolinensis]|nr:hypothetical protein NC651_020868 [Populus alba x Populus x berolinensis]
MEAQQYNPSLARSQHPALQLLPLHIWQVIHFTTLGSTNGAAHSSQPWDPLVGLLIHYEFPAKGDQASPEKGNLAAPLVGLLIQSCMDNGKTRGCLSQKQENEKYMFWF